MYKPSNSKGVLLQFVQTILFYADISPDYTHSLDWYARVMLYVISWLAWNCIESLAIIFLPSSQQASRAIHIFSSQKSELTLT